RALRISPSERELPVGFQMPERRGAFARTLIEPSKIVVRVGGARVRCDRALVRVNRIGGTAEVFEDDAEIERRRRVPGTRAESEPIVRLGGAELPGLVEEPAEIHHRVGVSRIELERSPVGVTRAPGG